MTADTPDPRPVSPPSELTEPWRRWTKYPWVAEGTSIVMVAPADGPHGPIPTVVARSLVHADGLNDYIVSLHNATLDAARAAPQADKRDEIIDMEARDRIASVIADVQGELADERVRDYDRQSWENHVAILMQRVLDALAASSPATAGSPRDDVAD